jgi:geranylgeranyl diphosphate synthase type II
MNLSDDLRDYLRTRQTLVEGRLGEIVRQQECPAGLREAMEYSLLAPGKRLRPALVFIAAEAAGGEDEQALPAACAVEMIHTYSLIHDDLPAMDDDDLRRGLPSCHKKFGEALAILAGDSLLTLAFQVLTEGCPPTTAAASCRELARGAGAAGMVGGQVLDLAWENGGDKSGARREERGGIAAVSEATAHTLEALENIHSQKTGALVRACLRLGVVAAQGERPAGPDPVVWESLDAFGRCFGLVFQITDDLLDVEGTALHTGKRVGKDACRGKLTYPGLLGVAESRRRARQLAETALEQLQPLGASGNRLAALTQLALARDR